MTAGHDQPRSATDEQVLAWVETTLGGTVTWWGRQPRWRPVWFVDVAVGGAVSGAGGDADPTVQRVVVRGERSDTPLVFPLDHEMRFQQVAARHGVPVAPVIGWNDGPRSFAMAAVPGKSDFAGVPSADRATIVDEYLQALVRLHRAPVGDFVAAGIIHADRQADVAYIGQRQYERMYRATKVRPDPLLEFVLGWLARHPLPANDRVAPIVWDSGQFHHDGGHLQAILDLEIAHVGDPMMDLAAWRMRDTVIPFGNFTDLYARYEELSGAPVDLAAIQFHHLYFTLTNQLAFHAPLAVPTPDTDYMTYAQWVSETNLHAIETMAEYLGVELAPVDVPEPQVSPVTALHEHQSLTLRSIQVEDAHGAYRLRGAFRLARHLARFDAIGAELVAQDVADVGALTGQRVISWEQSEAELERFVLADHGAHDRELVQLFNRRLWRYKALMGPPGSAMATHHTLQPLGRWQG